MSWLIEPQPSQETLFARFRELVESPEILILPGAPDPLAAKIAKDLGVKALYLSGAAYTAQRALPDLGLVHSSEVAERARDLIRASALPLLVDIDTGFGGVLSVARTAREMVEARVAAVQIEDQDLPKKCGHLSGKTLVTAEEMAQKIYALKQAAPTLYVVARTDAVAVEGVERAIERARIYVEAGADAIFPEALTDEEMFRRFREEIRSPLLANMTEFGKTPYFTAEQFASWGYEMVIFPVTALRMAAQAYVRTYETLMKTGTQTSLLEEMQTRKALYETIRYDDYEALDQRIAKSTLP
ncbi:MAG: methylisocitrate lyase [Candidatus Carbobacillus altaicus]|nr:methylisocitrate lyase [Candidatus Carbobacillus altaicus]